MFPLNSNDQYIDNNGKRSKLSEAIGSGGSELPEHSEADAGKVLKVADDGSLEWDEEGGAGGVYVGTTNPDPLIGENGDYYYKRTNSFMWVDEFTPSGSSMQTIYGNEIVIAADCVITSLSGYIGSDMTGSLRIGNLTDVIETISDVNFTSNTWATANLVSPIEAHAGDHFIIQIVLPSAGNIRYGQYSASYTYKSQYAEYVQGRYNGYPGTADSGTRVGVSFNIESEAYYVTNQYYKKNNAWVEL